MHVHARIHGVCTCPYVEGTKEPQLAFFREHHPFYFKTSFLASLNQAQVFMFVWQALDQWSHLSNPENAVFQ